ncbi:MAG TPA: MMPL family transporter [Rhodocyclaceae bacterium]|nr:MMPL family transporter [Rhodocyclaceae bacterium]
MAWRQWAAYLWVAIALACAAFVGLRFSQGSPVEADLLALLPPTERNPNAEAAVKVLSDRLGNRVLFLVGHPDGNQAKTLAHDFADRLRQSDAFARVIDQAPKVDGKLVAEIYAPYRAALLTSADRKLLQDPVFDAEALLLRRMYQPFHAGLPTDTAVDPFGFLQHWLSRLPLAQTALTIEDGVLVARDGGNTYVLVLAEPTGNAFDAATQGKVVAAVDAAETRIKAQAPQAAILRTGGLFYGHAARTSAQREVDLIGGGSLIGILILLWSLFRSLRPLALGMGTVAIGIACGMASVLALDGKIHLITLVFGASLIGEAVDYAIQYFAAHLDSGDQWNPEAGLRRVLPGLAVAVATSLIGYGALSLTPFPAVSQIALFAFVGLSTAWVSVVLLLPRFVRRPCGRDADQSVRLPRRILSTWREKATPRLVAMLSLAIIAVSIPGWLRLAPDDDVRQLVSRPASLTEQESVIRRLAGAGGSGRFFLVEGGNDEEALQREEALTERLLPKIGHGIAGFSAISDFVPSQATQDLNRRLLASALPQDKVAKLLDGQGFQPAAAQAWSAALADTASSLTLADWRNGPLAMPVKHQMLPPGTSGMALLVTLTGDDGSLDLSALSAGLPGISVVDKTASVSALFAEYRRLATLWLPAALAIVLAILAARYGIRQGTVILIPTLLAMGAALAAYGYSGTQLTLFTMMGLVLVLGVGVNYAIFVVEAGDRAPAPFAGVVLSAATTILSFGLLSLSSMPALHQFGLVLLIGVGCSVLLAPIALTLAGGKKPCA